VEGHNVFDFQSLHLVGAAKTKDLLTFRIPINHFPQDGDDQGGALDLLKLLWVGLYSLDLHEVDAGAAKGGITKNRGGGRGDDARGA